MTTKIEKAMRENRLQPAKRAENPETGVGELEDAIQTAEARLWEMHTRLGEAYYGGVYQQLDDMIAMGKLAERVKMLRDARHAMREPLPDVRPMRDLLDRLDRTEGK